jgi:hypothetical protein
MVKYLDLEVSREALLRLRGRLEEGFGYVCDEFDATGEDEPGLHWVLREGLRW